MFRRISLALVLLFAAARAGVATAQPLADRVPADAIIYVGWAGAHSLGSGYEGSHLKAVLEAGEVPKFIDEVMPKLLDRLAQEEQDAAEVAAVAKSLLTPMWQHATALYVGPVDMTNPNRPQPRVAILCDAGEDAPKMKQQVEGLLKEAGNTPFPVTVKQTGNLVSLTIGKVPALDGVVDGKSAAKSLKSAKNFAPVTSVQKSPVIAAYVDVEAVVKLVDDVVAKENNPEAKEKWPAARDALGLDGLKRVTLAQGFDGKEWGTHAFIEAPAPRKGLLAGLEAEPVSDDAFKIIPSGATMAGVSRLDLAGLFDGVRQAVEQLEPNAKQQVDGAIEQVNAVVGMDVRQDVLGALGDQWAYYIAPEVTGRGPLGVVVVNRLKDEAKANQASAKLKELANNLIASQINEPNISVSLKEATIGGVKVTYLATPYVSPAWAVSGGNLYVSLYPQITAQAAGHVAGNGKSILDNPGFVALRKRLGGEKAVSVQFYDLPKSAPTSYQIWLLVSSFAKLGDIFGVDTPPALLPPLGKLMQHLAVGGAVSYVDDKGWHFRAVTPFPGSTLLASDTGGVLDLQTSALGMSILLPSLNRAREQANRIKSASNLRQIGMGVMIYANENKGKFPDDFAVLHASGDLAPAVFVNPNTNNEVPAEEGDVLKEWLKDGTDYVYVGKGKTYKAGADEVLAYEKLEGAQDGINVLYCDGHVEFKPMHEAYELIEKLKK